MSLPPAGGDRGSRRGLLATLDLAFYRFEQTVVTAAALVMTATVTLDIIYRAFASNESKLADKLASLLGIFAEVSEGTRVVLREWVAPGLLALTTLAVGWGIYAAIRRRKGLPRSRLRGAAVGLLTLAASYGFIRVLLAVPSRWVCFGLLLAATAGYGTYAVSRRAYRQAALVSVLGGFGLWGATHLRQGYIWSQELSLILLSWVAFLGASMATRERKHIVVDALSRALPRRAAPWTRAAGLAITAVFCGFVSALAYHHVFGKLGDVSSGETRPATGIPAWTITLPILISFVVMTLRFGGAAIAAFRHPSASGPDLHGALPAAPAPGGSGSGEAGEVRP